MKNLLFISITILALTSTCQGSSSIQYLETISHTCCEVTSNSAVTEFTYKTKGYLSVKYGWTLTNDYVSAFDENNILEVKKAPSGGYVAISHESLNPATTYYSRAFLIVDGKCYGGQIATFTTLKQ